MKVLKHREDGEFYPISVEEALSRFRKDTDVVYYIRENVPSVYAVVGESDILERENECLSCYSLKEFKKPVSMCKVTARVERSCKGTIKVLGEDIDWELQLQKESPIKVLLLKDKSGFPEEEFLVEERYHGFPEFSFNGDFSEWGYDVYYGRREGCDPSDDANLNMRVMYKIYEAIQKKTPKVITIFDIKRRKK